VLWHLLNPSNGKKPDFWGETPAECGKLVQGKGTIKGALSPLGVACCGGTLSKKKWPPPEDGEEKELLRPNLGSHRVDLTQPRMRGEESKGSGLH